MYVSDPLDNGVLLERAVIHCNNILPGAPITPASHTNIIRRIANTSDVFIIECIFLQNKGSHMIGFIFFGKNMAKFKSLFLMI